MQVLQILDGLGGLWFDVLSIINGRDLDPSYYSVFRDLFEDWMEKAAKQNLPGFLNAVRVELQGLSSSVALSTGLSMSILWEAVRPLVPSSLEQWSVYDQLRSLLGEFETRVAFQIGTFRSILKLIYSKMR